jgi:hypothetical protein
MGGAGINMPEQPSPTIEERITAIETALQAAGSFGSVPQTFSKPSITNPRAATLQNQVDTVASQITDIQNGTGFADKAYSALCDQVDDIENVVPTSALGGVSG